MNRQSSFVTPSQRSQQISRCFRVMKVRGFETEIVRPILIRVVKERKDDWTYIEVNNYKNIEDAIKNQNPNGDDATENPSSLLIHDITKGTENMKIPLLKTSATNVVPTFNYVPYNIVYLSASTQISSSSIGIADDGCCEGDNCLSSSNPHCACAQLTTGGEFAYNHQGLLNEKFLQESISSKEDKVYCEETCPLDESGECKGHTNRLFVKECWVKCGCTMQCGNRVVQRGITRKLQVFRADGGKGWGVRTLEKLPAGAFICEYSGEILTNNELADRNEARIGSKHEHTYPVLLDADWSTEKLVDDDEGLCLDATHYGNVARFMNHRCSDGNMIEIPVQVETTLRRYYHLAFFTTREVDALEELTWDYGIDFDDETHPIDAFQCTCGSAQCRGRSRKRKR